MVPLCGEISLTKPQLRGNPPTVEPGKKSDPSHTEKIIILVVKIYEEKGNNRQSCVKQQLH